MKTYVPIVLSLVLLGAQVPSTAHAEGRTGDAAGACKTVAVPPKCQQASHLTINAKTKKASPPNLCVKVGTSVQVKVVPGPASAKIVSKDGDAWLSGEGTSFSIQVPESALGRHDYAVYFEDGSCLDPAVFGLD